MPDEGNRDELIKRVSGAEFNQANAEFIGQKFGLLLEDEFAFTKTQPQLFSLPFSATADLPRFDPDTDGEVRKKWKEFIARMEHPNRGLEIIAINKENDKTWLRFDSHLLRFSRDHLWRCYILELDGIDLPLIVAQTTIGSEILPKTDKLSDYDVEELSLAYVRQFSSTGQTDQDEEASRRRIRQQRKMDKVGEAMALNLLINDPGAFVKYFDREKMFLHPDRLMTDFEFQEWQKMMNEILSIGEKKTIIVGTPGYGSYQRYEAIFQFGFDSPILKSTDLKENGQPTSLFSLHIPIPIKVENKLQGYSILKIYRSSFPSKPSVRFEHCANDLYYWYQWKKQ